MSEKWRDALDAHQNAEFAHPRILVQIERRLNVLEAFKAQATLLGGIGLIILGAVITIVIGRLAGLIH